MSQGNKQNLAVWLDVPVKDLDRAISFYSAVVDREVNKESFESFEFGVVMHETGNGACLVVMENGSPSADGILVYFNVDGRIRDAVEKVTQHGGEVLQEVHAIGPHGYRALVLDSEGNRIALHSDSDA